MLLAIAAIGIPAGIASASANYLAETTKASPLAAVLRNGGPEEEKLRKTFKNCKNALPSRLEQMQGEPEKQKIRKLKAQLLVDAEPFFLTRDLSYHCLRALVA